jgi:hypothetical protein
MSFKSRLIVMRSLEAHKKLVNFLRFYQPSPEHEVGENHFLDIPSSRQVQFYN